MKTEMAIMSKCPELMQKTEKKRDRERTAKLMLFAVKRSISMKYLIKIIQYKQNYVVE